MTPLHKLNAKLCRELAQSERSAIVHTRREARRLGDVPPANALRDLGAHAAQLKPSFSTLMSSRQPAGSVVGRSVGELFSTVRNLLFDRMIDAERSYRGTLLGFHHGVTVARLLRAVAVRLNDDPLVSWCDELLADRVPLLDAAEEAVVWFANRPELAVQSGLRLAFE